MEPRFIEPAHPFYDRQRELAMLERAWARRGSGLAMLYGRRRVGKTYLLQRFLSRIEGAGGRCYFLADQSSAEVQRLQLAERLVEAFPAGLTAPELATSWNLALRYFSAQSRANSAKSILILDEFPYLVAQTPALPSIIQAWWDEDGRQGNCLVVLCGSQTAQMSALEGASAPLHGRFNAGRIRLEPMDFREVSEFYEGMPGHGPYEWALMYGVLGGTPRYHGEIARDLPWDAQIVDLLLRPGAPFEDEVRYLLQSENIRDPAPYNAILRAVARGRTRHSEILSASGLPVPTAINHPLDTLQSLGWIVKERSFGETNDRRAIYRLSDPFLSFWFRFGAPNASALRVEDPMQVFDARIRPHLDDYMGGTVFEGMCAQWLARFGRTRLGYDVQETKRYWSRDGRTEINLVSTLGTGNHLFGECKWSARTQVGWDIYAQLQAKVSSLPNERWRENARYILFSMGGFTSDLRTLGKSGAVTLIGAEDLYEGR